LLYVVSGPTFKKVASYFTSYF